MPVFALTQAMIRQCLDDATVANASMPAFVNHTGQLRLQGLQARDAPVHFGQVIASNAVGLVTRLLRRGGHGEQLANIVHFKAKLAGMSNEIEPINLGSSISPLTLVRPLGFGEQPDLLIEANCRHFDRCAPSQLADCEIRHFSS